ncbi:MAG: hypothetical protein ACOZCO_08490 [Bacteroidota bacterium]
MSNTASDHLHRLIKALTKPEKRYFKVFSSRHTLGEANNYQLLFDAIEKMEEYDEEAIRKKFARDAFVKQLSIAKARLYDQVLRSLDSFHANSSIDAELKKLIHSAEILYKKTLYAQSHKLLKSAKKLAIKYEKHTTLLEILMWEKKLIEKDNYTEIGEAELEQIHREDHLTLEKITNYVDFWNIKSRMFYILNRKGKARSQDELSSFKSIIDNVLLRSEDAALYFETKYLYYHIYSAYFFSIGDYENSFLNLKKNVEHIENNVELFKEEPNIYFSVLTNIIYIGSRLKKYDEVFYYLEKLRSLPEKMALNRNEDLDIKLFSSAYSIELTVYSMTGEFEKGIELVPIIEEGLKLYGDKINNVRKAYFFFNIAVMYFAEKKYSEALRWINQLLNNIAIDKSEDIHCFAQMLNLIIHLELGNQRLVPYALKSTHRYLSLRNRVYKFETMILHFINKIMRVRDKEDEENVYVKLLSELNTLSDDNFEKSAFEYFDFVSWAESKVNGKDFKEIVKKKAHPKNASSPVQ